MILVVVAVVGAVTLGAGAIWVQRSTEPNARTAALIRGYDAAAAQITAIADHDPHMKDLD